MKFKTNNRYRIVLWVCALFYSAIAMGMLYALDYNIEKGDTANVMFIILILAFFILFDLWLIAVATESIEVNEGFITIRYLFFYRRTIGVGQITEVFINTMRQRNMTNSCVGIYIDGKRLLLPIQPHQLWINYIEWKDFVTSLGVPVIHENGTNECWPIGILGKRRIKN